MLRVLLVDNDSSCLERMQGFPWPAHQCECIGVAQSGEQVAQLSRQLTPHIVVMDVCLSGEDGVSLMRRIRAGFSEMQIIVLTACRSFEYAQAALDEGAIAYVLKDERMEEALGRALDKAYRAFSVRPEDLRSSLLKRANRLLQLNTSGILSVEMQRELTAITARHAHAWILSIRLRRHGRDVAPLVEQLDRLHSSQNGFPEIILYDGAFFELVFDGGPEEIRQWCARLQPSAPPFDDLMYMVYDGPFCGVQEYQNCHLRCTYTLKSCFYARENTLAQARPSEAKYLPAAYSEEWVRQLELKCGDGQAVKAYLFREVLPVLLQNRPDPEYVREMLERWLRRFELIFEKKPLLAYREEIRLAVHVWDAISVFSNALDELLPEKGEISYALQSALNYMRAHLDNPALRLQDVAAYVAVSPGYLSRRFKAEMGVSYQEMLTRVRMERAVTLLRAGGSRVYQVAEQCGYSSYRSFENAFSNYYGQSPKTFK